MAIPSDPSVTSIVTEALRRGGRTTPNSTQIVAAIEHQFREVKSDITQRSSRHQALETQIAIPTFDGQSRYTWPTDADDIRSITLVTSDSTTYWQGAAQTGAATSITLHASFSQDPSDVKGKFVFLPVTGQIAQILSYTNATKVAGLDRTWVTNPGVGTSYHIGLQHDKIYSMDKPWGYDTLTAPFGRGTPRRAALVGREIWTDVAADKTYVLWVDYWSNLDRIDEVGAVFLRHLRDYRSLWIQGVTVKTMQRFDEDRYQSELQVYGDMLNAYAGYSAGVGQVIWTDV